MIVRPEQRETEHRKNMRGGNGECALTPLAGKVLQKHCRLLSEILIPAGAGIGRHDHVAETEYYYILEGRGMVDDDGKAVEVGPGDLVVTTGGAFHSIEALADAALRMLAVIVTDD
jgi:mannose-6-phosphate isomerase-like protein (cupin superfamily)